jgi:hypothetical protein
MPSVRDVCAGHAMTDRQACAGFVLRRPCSYQVAARVIGAPAWLARSPRLLRHSASLLHTRRTDVAGRAHSLVRPHTSHCALSRLGLVHLPEAISSTPCIVRSVATPTYTGGGPAAPRGSPDRAHEPDRVIALAVARAVSAWPWPPGGAADSTAYPLGRPVRHARCELDAVDYPTIPQPAAVQVILPAELVRHREPGPRARSRCYTRPSQAPPASRLAVFSYRA